MSEVQQKVHIVDEGWSSWDAVKEKTAKEQDAFYVLDVKDIVHKFLDWKQKMPRVKTYYAVKCNDLPIVLDVLAALGTGFDCASENEISKILNMGVSPDRIIFANPAKPISHLKYAKDHGVATMTFDNDFELKKIKEYFPAARLVIRIRCDAKIAQCPLGLKFGCDPMLEAPHLMEIAKSLDLNVVGVSFHVGSGCHDLSVYSRAIKHAARIFHLGRDLGFKMNLLDIGGGFSGNTGTSIAEVALIVNKALEERFPVEEGVNIIAEPGRYFVSSAFTLACHIYAKRILYDKKHDVLKQNMYFVNDGVYGSFNSVLYDHQKVNAIPLKWNIDKIVPCSIWGPTCDGLDQIIPNVFLPDMDIGDWLIFKDMGAYTIPVASPFNGFPVPKVTSYITRDIWKKLKDAEPLNKRKYEEEI